MSLGFLVSYLGGAAVWTAVWVAVIWAGWRLWARLAGGPAPVPARELPVLVSLGFFLMLTQYPFPDRATMICPVPGVRAEVMPFNTVPQLMGIYGRWGWEGVFDSTLIPAAVMNVVFCLFIGAALVWQGRLSDRAILLFGAGLTLAVETTQLTGIWGLYPCAYRQFDTDDLITNFLGVALGLRLARSRGWGRPRLGQPAE
ncbi:VanZ family protein [Frigidibacter sp. MR17.24]|uniref:VanZ family protein n=1 Tax=Frigidibacter sp. MR17.24 TaxID=3127345 RepID=UPI003012DE0F